MSGNDDRAMSRRAALKVAMGALGVVGLGTARGHDSESARESEGCPEVTKRPSMIHYEESGMAGCTDDHPVTEKLHADVADSLANRFPTVGSLIEADFVPYFDFFTAEGAGAWSHWISPSFLDDDAVLDPTTPESILVDHQWWRPIGVMFVATSDGDRVDPPPTVYGEEGADVCLPWHAHVGLPGRYSWGKFRVLYEDGIHQAVDGLPCRTPWMMHMWAYPHPESLYAHDAPPQGSRGGPPAEDPGFETDADPSTDELSPEVLPDAYLARIEQAYH